MKSIILSLLSVMTATSVHASSYCDSLFAGNVKVGSMALENVVDAHPRCELFGTTKMTFYVGPYRNSQSYTYNQNQYPMAQNFDLRKFLDAIKESQTFNYQYVEFTGDAVIPSKIPAGSLISFSPFGHFGISLRGRVHGPYGNGKLFFWTYFYKKGSGGTVNSDRIALNPTFDEVKNSYKEWFNFKVVDCDQDPEKKLCTNNNFVN